MHPFEVQRRYFLPRLSRDPAVARRSPQAPYVFCFGDRQNLTRALDSAISSDLPPSRDLRAGALVSQQVEDVYEIPEEDFERLLQASLLWSFLGG